MVDAIKEFFGHEKYREKKVKQELFDALTNSQDGLYVYDPEFKQRGSKCENEPDMLAVRYAGGKPKSIVLIEVKSKWEACEDGTSGLMKHLDGMNYYIKESPYINNRKQEAQDIISAYKALNLHNPPMIVPNLEDIKSYEMMIILSDSAVDYYQDFADVIQEYIQEHKYNCEIMEWTDTKLLKELFRN